MSPTFGEHFTSDLPRTPLGRSSQHSTSRHSGEAFSTAPHPPKFGHIGQTFNARGFAYANCCTLQPLVARQCPGGGFGIVYCCPTAAKTSIIPLGPFIFLRDLQKKQRADERTRTAFLLITSVRSVVAGHCMGLQTPHNWAIRCSPQCPLLQGVASGLGSN